MERKERTKISSYIITLYAFIIFCIYPFYYENGYYNMGTAKCRFYLTMSVIAVLTLLVAIVIDLIMQKKENNVVYELKKIELIRN